jgi:hypothetical protein
MRDDIECTPDLFFQMCNKIKHYQVFTGLIFVRCIGNQEDACQNQERNHQEISLNDYLQQHTKMCDN